MTYKEWLDYQSKLQKRDVSQDEENYDLESYYNSLKANPGEPGKFDSAASSGHLPDTFKKPNHPTFSKDSMYSIPGIQEGGEWNKDFSEYTPSDVNMRNKGLRGLDNYFEEVEPSVKLNLPKTEKFSKLRKKIKK
jgi:hypothetical protein